MCLGAEKMTDGTLKGFMDFTPEEIMNKSIFSIKQDINLLRDNIVPLGGKKIKEILDRRGITADDIDYFLPHISSDFFRSKIYDMIQIYGGGIPYEKWFINLYTVGNVGAASVFLMINELFHSGRLKKGEKLLLIVPESARFSYMYAMLTVC
jgi:3-oxoacyl-[acyl-carrier-protein] synthase-3